MTQLTVQALLHRVVVVALLLLLAEGSEVLELLEVVLRTL